MIKQVSEMPTEGRFVAVWEYEGNPCSFKLKWNKYGELIYLDDYIEEVGELIPDQFINDKSCLYFIVEKGENDE